MRISAYRARRRLSLVCVRAIHLARVRLASTDAAAIAQSRQHVFGLSGSRPPDRKVNESLGAKKL